METNSNIYSFIYVGRLFHAYFDSQSWGKCQYRSTHLEHNKHSHVSFEVDVTVDM